MATLTVHLGRDGAHDVECPSSFETDGSFSLRLLNHGTPAHVHLRLDDALSRVLALDTHNHYVEEDATIAVPVVEDRPEEVTGSLEVVTGYGAADAAVTITLTRPAGVVVDESLSTPRTDESERPERGDREPGTAAVGVLAAVAVLAVGALAVAVENTAVVLLGAVGVLLALGVAAYRVRS